MEPADEQTTASLPPPGSRTVWITGAGSGVGRAVALSAAAAGARVVLTGRRAEALAETASLVRGEGGHALELPCDTTQADALEQAYATLRSQWGAPTDLVLSAGLNAPRRYWRTSR